MTVDYAIINDHKEWLGLLQPVGLVVSPPALAKCQAIVNRNGAVALQQKLYTVVSRDPITAHGDNSDTTWISDFPLFVQEILEWEPSDLVGADGQKPIPPELEVSLTDYGEVLAPTYAVPDPDNQDQWLLLIQVIKPGTELDNDDIQSDRGHGWRATPQEKFERLLREVQVPIGLLCNGSSLRLVYAPRGESSGHITFPVQPMTEVAGRPILGALHMLLGADRLFNLPTELRLPKLLTESREHQAEVSTKLADQVLNALWELLRGFQAADATSNGAVLQDLPKTNPQHIYGGLITTLMRLVFLLYSEDKGLMPEEDEVYQQSYSVSMLYERLREDAGAYPDTMDQRFGAWPWLLSLFRLVYDGGGATPDYLPARHGQLFDPDEYPFLEGRKQDTSYKNCNRIDAPRIPDGNIYRLLTNLLILDGERLSYRTLDVEQIGSVYEAIMGFEIEIASGHSIAVRPKDVVVNIDEILSAKPAERTKLLEAAECKLSGKSATELKQAKTVEEITAALDRRISSRTPQLLPPGALYLQPGEERRRSGSHYTPRKLTQPLVETTLRPVLKRLGEHPSSEAILDLKICDLAMGSAAFLVEVCRQLAEHLVEAWQREDRIKDFPDNAEPLLIARRLVAQRCLYGVDKNPFAVNLAKLSLWLVTLAKDFPFTFLDHALKCGDSLVGLSKAEIDAFGRDNTYEDPLLSPLKKSLERALSYRLEIQSADTESDADAAGKYKQLLKVEEEIHTSRVVGDVAVSSFFKGENKKERDKYRKEFESKVRAWRHDAINDRESQIEKLADIEGISIDLHQKTPSLIPFHWEVEFPEVFQRKNPGFDVIVGNPPFLGYKNLSGSLGNEYCAWLLSAYPETGGTTDLCAYFFRLAYTLLSQRGTLGLIATNTIGQGDTRKSGLSYLLKKEMVIYSATSRLQWIGMATVTVSVVHLATKELASYSLPALLNELPVDNINSQLKPRSEQGEVAQLVSNKGKYFFGTTPLGKGFILSEEERNNLLQKNEKNGECIFPYLTGQDVNSDPHQKFSRYIINFGSRDLEQASQWSDLIEIVRERVKPERDKLRLDNSAARQRRERWWRYAGQAQDLYDAIADFDRCLVCSAMATKYLSFSFQPTGIVFSNALVVFPRREYSYFAILQSSTHEYWTRLLSSSLREDLRYSASDCFETFPFPENWDTHEGLEFMGKEYYEFRTQLMIRYNQGLTDTYNRFHDPDETNPDILKLRDLHAQMDRAVFDAYDWKDLNPECDFYLDYEEEESDTSSKRKKPWRYRWSDKVQDEVLVRLLELNAKRAEEERLLGQTGAKKKGSKTKAKSDTTPKQLDQLSLFATKEINQ